MNTFPRAPGRRYLLLIAPMALIIAVLLVLVDATMENMSAGRAYVGGEGLWSKAQKDAVYHLLRYSRSGDESHFRLYREAIAVPLGDRKAREALDRPEPDYEAARQGFLEGRNHPEDVDAMARMFVRFRNVHHIDKAIAIWAEGDRLIAQLEEAAARVRRELTSGRPDPSRIEALREEIHRISLSLGPLEDAFSFTLGEATRWMRQVLFLVMIAAALLLVATAALALGRPLRRADAAEARLRDLARRLKRNARRMEFLAHHDTLTQLPNRVMLLDRLRQASSLARRQGRGIGLLFVDLDQFKHINDTLGHSTGDELLRGVAQRLRACVREEDLVARLGGDEFCVLLEGIDSPATAGTVAEKLLASLAASHRIGDRSLETGASIGIACQPEDGEDAETLLMNADIAMYRAKASGRHRYCYFDAARGQAGARLGNAA